MAYKLNDTEFASVIRELSKSYKVYAPKVQKGHGMFSDTDIVYYGEICGADEIEMEKKSMYSFKETVLPVSETLFYFIEKHTNVPAPAYEKAAVLLRNCELHALKRLDDIYRADGKTDFYYERLRNNVKFILIGCKDGFENCFCESMGTNGLCEYDGYIEADGNCRILESKFEPLTEILEKHALEKIPFTPSAITNSKTVYIPENIPPEIINSEIWDEYNSRCISCGRCNFVCPTCTCYTMQDIFYEDNKNAGERRRVWASCHVDGFSDIAGGISYRKTKGERMRFKVLHKISDHKKRYGKNMCVGCGRCEDVCPEYISYTNCISKVAEACKEVNNG